MKIAKHLCKRETTTYDVNDYSHERWLHHIKYSILCTIPKFSNMDDGEPHHTVDESVSCSSPSTPPV